MSKAGLGSKNRYQQCIHMYLKRREEYKNKYGKTSKRYLQLSKGIQRKLDIWRGAIRRIEKRDVRIKSIDDRVLEFIGKSAYNSVGTKDELVILARNLFIRYGIENGIQGVFLADYVNLKFRQDASRYRLQFIRSFPKNRNNKEIWYRFQEFMNRDNIKIAA